uniref:Uncharacterized protein n=1 Tax=Arundo donax TaxID=35708 RepID=A0A0A9FNZ0_ARUDO
MLLLILNMNLIGS